MPSESLAPDEHGGIRRLNGNEKYNAVRTLCSDGIVFFSI